MRLPFPPIPLAPIWVVSILPALHHPHDIIDCVELSPTFAEDRTVFATSDGTLNILGRSKNGGFSWRDVRSGATGKHVYAMILAQDFARSGRALIALGPDGLAWSQDHGTTWSVAPQPCDARLLAALPFSGADEPTVLAAGPKGLFRFGGPTSDLVELDPGRFRAAPPTALAAALTRSGASVVFAATRDGRLHRSDDGGTTWKTLPKKTGDVRRVTPSPRFAEDSTLWLATFGGGVLVSRDAGETFAPSNQGLSDLFVNDVAVPARWPECLELFAATKDAGLFRSTDGGEHWELTSLQVEKTYQTDDHHRFVRVPADYPQTSFVFCGTFEGLHFSLDGGKHWIKSNLNPTRFGRRIEVSPDFAHDHAVFTSGYGMLLAASNDAGANWSFGAAGVRALSSYALSVAPTWRDEGLLILGINEGTWRSTDRGATWTKLLLPPFVRPTGGRQDHDITQVVYSPRFAEDRTCYAVSFGGVYVSNDAAESFRCLPPPVDHAVVIALTPEFPSDPTIFVGGSRLKYSTDGGVSWSNELVRFPVSGMVCAPDWATTGEAYAWSGYVGFVRSVDRGRTWRISNSGLGGHRPTAVRLTPRFASTGVMFMTTFGGGLFRSADRGRSWSRFGSRDPRLDHCSALALSPAFERDGTMFLGNLDGVWRSTDGGESFGLTTTRELYDQAREPWLRAGKWTRPDRRHAFGGTVDQARHAGNTLSFPFVGSGLKLLGTRGPDHGWAEIVIDQGVAARVDCYSPEPQDSGVIFEDPGLPWGHHVLTVRVVGEKSSGSRDVLVGVDAAEIVCVGPAEDVPVFATH